MGKTAATLADVVVVTSDNPRSEDPDAIIDEVVAGIPSDSQHLVVPDRRLAIRAALRGRRDGDVVVIAGKGHETGQTAGGVTVPFDDRVVAPGRQGLGAPGSAGARGGQAGVPGAPDPGRGGRGHRRAGAGRRPLGRRDLLLHRHPVARPGALFVALRAERDGHDFVAAAFAGGAVAALVSRADAKRRQAAGELPLPLGTAVFR